MLKTVVGEICKCAVCMQLPVFSVSHLCVICDQSVFNLSKMNIKLTSSCYTHVLGYKDRSFHAVYETGGQCFRM